MMGNQGKSEHITKTLWTQIMADHIWVFSELYMQWFIHESLPQTFTPWTDSLLTSTSLLNIKWEAFKNIMIDDDYIFSPGTSDWSCLTILKFEIKNPNVAKCSITIPSPSHANTLRQSKPVRVQGSRPQKVTLALGQRDGFQKRNSGQATERSTYSPGSQASTQQIHLCGKGCFQLGQKTRWRGKHVIGATEDVPVCRDANITRSATVLGKRASEAESRRFYKGMSQCSHRVVYSPSGRCH